MEKCFKYRFYSGLITRESKSKKKKLTKAELVSTTYIKIVNTDIVTKLISVSLLCLLSVKFVQDMFPSYMQNYDSCKTMKNIVDIAYFLTTSKNTQLIK